MGEYGFQKRRIKTNFFDCNQPLMAQLPIELGTMTYKNRDGSVSSIINYRPYNHNHYSSLTSYYYILGMYSTIIV